MECRCRADRREEFCAALHHAQDFAEVKAALKLDAIVLQDARQECAVPFTHRITALTDSLDQILPGMIVLHAAHINHMNNEEVIVGPAGQTFKNWPLDGPLPDPAWYAPRYAPHGLRRVAVVSPG
jgi:hypothetical protein